MRFSELLGVAWEGVVANKVRALLTMLGVIIGVAAVIVMVAISAGTEAAIAEQINGLGANLIFVQPAMTSSGVQGMMRGGSMLYYSDVALIEAKVPNVAGVSVEQTSSQVVQAGSESVDAVTVTGTTPDFGIVRELEMSSGRFFTDEEVERSSKVAVLGATLAQELFGDTYPVGEKITVGDTRVTVIGVLDEKGLVSGVDFDSQMYVPITLVFDKFMNNPLGRIIGDSVRSIYITAESQQVIDEVITQTELVLAESHEVTLDEADFTVYTQADIIETQESTTESFRTLLGWVAAVSLVVGGIGIMNIMLVSVTERTREIGIRQAIGARPRDIQGQFLLEAMMLSLVGGIIGVGVGVGGAYLFGQVGDMRTVVMPASVLLAFGASAAVGVFFGYYPAKQASQLDPIAALHHE